MSATEVIKKIDEMAGEATSFEFQPNGFFISRHTFEAGIYTPGCKSYYVSHHKGFFSVSQAVLVATIYDAPVGRQTSMRNKIEYKPGGWEDRL